MKQQALTCYPRSQRVRAAAGDAAPHRGRDPRSAGSCPHHHSPCTTPSMLSVKPIKSVRTFSFKGRWTTLYSMSSFVRLAAHLSPLVDKISIWQYLSNKNAMFIFSLAWHTSPWVIHISVYLHLKSKTYIVQINHLYKLVSRLKAATITPLTYITPRI